MGVELWIGGIVIGFMVIYWVLTRYQPPKTKRVLWWMNRIIDFLLGGADG